MQEERRERFSKQLRSWAMPQRNEDHLVVQCYVLTENKGFGKRDEVTSLLRESNEQYMFYVTTVESLGSWHIPSGSRERQRRIEKAFLEKENFRSKAL